MDNGIIYLVSVKPQSYFTSSQKAALKDQTLVTPFTLLNVKSLEDLNSQNPHNFDFKWLSYVLLNI